MKKAMWTQSELLDKLMNCEDYKRLCDGDNISLLSTLDERENDTLSEQTRNLTLKTIYDEEVHGKWVGLMNESRNTRPHSAPCHRNNLAVIANTYQKREIPIEVEKSSSNMLHTLASHIGEDEISVEVNQQNVSKTLVDKTTDRLVEAMSSRLAELDSDKVIHVVSDKLVESISTEIMHSVSEKVAAVVSDKLLETIKSKVYINGKSRKLISERKNKNLDLEERKLRYFIIKS
ncbi:unnamed protein product [Mytilus edulis]|uniref:Uncharacterized protein n=1 Tax=Mytilus edulis TaxID=6550 RepID=A0A8S3RTN0_MYTED|nr:unnamed protein product [Mytilus edulis]